MGIAESGVAVEQTVVLLVGVENSSGNDLEVKECFWESGTSVNIPVGAAIADHHTTEVDVVEVGVESSLVFWFAVPALGFSESALGFQSLGRNVGRAVGSLSQSWLVQFTSRRNVVAVGLLGLSVHCLLFGFVVGPQSAMVVGILFGVTIGWLDALACSMAMDETDPVWPASSFALIMAFQNLGTLGSGLMASLAGKTGFPAAFAIAAAVNLFALTAWPLLDHKHKKPEQAEIWPV